MDFGGIFKIIQIQSKEIGNKKYYKETKELEKCKVRFRLQNIDIRKKKEGSWWNAIKTKVAFVRGRLKFSRKSTTAANVHLMESLLDNLLRNNHITIDIVITFAVCFYLGFFFRDI